MCILYGMRILKWRFERGFYMVKLNGILKWDFVWELVWGFC